MNDIIEAISMKLFELVGCTIYTESVKQGMKVPCFFVTHLNTTKTDLLNTRSKRSNAFDITYISNSKKDMLGVLDKLLDGLKFIVDTKGNRYHGTGMEAEIVDDILHVRVNYNYTTIDQTREVEMGSVSITQGVKQ